MYLYCFDARFSICLIACRCIIYSNPIITIILTLFIYYISILHCNAIICPPLQDPDLLFPDCVILHQLSH